jgi:hypothetical protein
VYERVGSRNSQDNAGELVKMNEGTTLGGERPAGVECNEKQREIFLGWQRIFV